MFRLESAKKEQNFVFCITVPRHNTDKILKTVRALSIVECLDKYKSNFWSKQKICVRELLNNLLASPYLEEEGIK